MAFAINTPVKFTGLPSNHPLLNSPHNDGVVNGPMGVVCGVGYYSPLNGKNPIYAIKVQAWDFGNNKPASAAIFYPVLDVNVVAAVSPNPQHPFAVIPAGTNAISGHHSPTP